MSKTPVVLIFGGNGWIGSKVVELLQNLNITAIKSLCRADDIPMNFKIYATDPGY